MKCAEETTAQTISKEAQDIVRKLFDKVKHNYFDPPTTATTEVTLIITVARPGRCFPYTEVCGFSREGELLLPQQSSWHPSGRRTRS